MNRNVIFSILRRRDLQGFSDKERLIRKGERIFSDLIEQGRIAPYYLPIDWEGFREHVTDTTDFENFGLSLSSMKSSLQAGIERGIENTNWKNVGIGAGIGGIAGLTYGYWDWQDEKKQAELKGLEKPNKKKILIRDTLVGLGLGATAGAFADKLVKILEDRKTTDAQKRMFDSIEKEILKGQDKPKIKKYLELHKNDLTSEQHKFLSELANSMTDREKLQDIREKRRNAFNLAAEERRNAFQIKLEKLRQKYRNNGNGKGKKTLPDHPLFDDDGKKTLPDHPIFNDNDKKKNELSSKEQWKQLYAKDKNKDIPAVDYDEIEIPNQNDRKYNKQIDKEFLRDINRIKDVHSRAYTTSPKKNKPKFGRPRLLPTQKGIDAQNALFESIFGQHYPF
jgi:hypothetical protein